MSDVGLAGTGISPELELIRGYRNMYWNRAESELLAMWDCDYEGIGGDHQHYKGRLYRTKVGGYVTTRQQRNWHLWWAEEFADGILENEREVLRELQGAQRGDGLDSKLEFTATGQAWWEALKARIAEEERILAVLV